MHILDGNDKKRSIRKQLIFQIEKGIASYWNIMHAGGQLLRMIIE